ncbi:Flp pilus assembly protein CpaB [Polymorphobacter megasporae]|uniref:Flp pilus assembly protein CpaB n=1 Tax=Glacieibacterium megasporae TaxID=2835787 RepID=UPI001C1DFDC6|nr:Flp pilus assembly protein CpaB [Polymorphobacter megasporae]UAJ08720.1 Flp pilus assembly protein CpaB [Polymorphobacter megasporae]
MLIGAIVLGLLAVLLMRTHIGTGGSSGVATAAIAPRSTPVVVASSDLPPAAAIDKTKLKLIDWPADSVPAGSFRSLAAIPADRGLMLPMVAGEPLLAGRMTGGTARPGIAPRIADGMRAATVRVTDVTGTGGFILPGARVDVLITQAATQSNTPFNDVLFENVRVIAVNQDANEAKDKPEVAQTVTIEISPVQSQKLALAQTVGTVSLVLRNPANAASGPITTVHVSDLRASPATSSADHAPRRIVRVSRREPVATARTSIEIVRGVDRATYQIARSQ